MFSALLAACGLGLFGLGIGMSVEGEFAAGLLSCAISMLTLYGAYLIEPKRTRRDSGDRRRHPVPSLYRGAGTRLAQCAAMSPEREPTRLFSLADARRRFDQSGRGVLEVFREVAPGAALERKQAFRGVGADRS